MTNIESPAELAGRRFGWSDMFVAPEDDPRSDGGFANDERSMLLGYLADRRRTFEMKCADLDASAMATRSVPPSDMSLLGLLRHLTDVERHWFRPPQRPRRSASSADRWPRWSVAARTADLPF